MSCLDRGLGDNVETVLSSLGITSERVTRWLGRACGCDERKHRLNQLGSWAARWLSGRTAKAEQYLKEMLDDK